MGGPAKSEARSRIQLCLFGHGADARPDFCESADARDLQQFRIAHINSDFPSDYTSDIARGTGDHDPNVAVFKFPASVITINSPNAQSYLHPDFLTLDFAVTGLDVIGQAAIDGVSVSNGQKIDLYTLSLGNHTMTVNAVESGGHILATQSVTFSVIATVQSLKASVNRFYQEGKINKVGTRDSLLNKLNIAQNALNVADVKGAINQLNAFINGLEAQSGKSITSQAAALLVTDAQYVIANPK